MRDPPTIPPPKRRSNSPICVASLFDSLVWTSRILTGFAFCDRFVSNRGFFSSIETSSTRVFQFWQEEQLPVHLDWLCPHSRQDQRTFVLFMHIQFREGGKCRSLFSLLFRGTHSNSELLIVHGNKDMKNLSMIGFCFINYFVRRGPLEFLWRVIL